MADIGRPEQHEQGPELELTEQDQLIDTLRQEILTLKARLEDQDPPRSSSPPRRPSSSSSPDQTEVVQLLRSSLSETAADRDDLLQSLAITRSEQATLQARLSDLEEENEMLLMSRIEASKAAEEEKEKRIAGEETIAMLRSTVEEARKGLMRLQTEKNFKRTSSNPAGLGFDMGGAQSGGVGVDGLPLSGGGSNPPSSFFSSSAPPPTPSTITSKRDKRASLNVGYGVVPAGRSGNLHRRVSSISDSAIPFVNPSSDPSSSSSSSIAPAPLNKAGLRELRLAGPPPPVSSGISSFLGFGGAAAAASPMLDGRRVSQLSVPASPSKAPIEITSDLSDGGGSDAGAIEASRLAAMRKLEGIPAPPIVDPAELVALRTQMGSLQAELVEAREAREASESACRALREFIAFSSSTNEAAAAAGRGGGGAGADLEGGGFGNGAGVERGMLLPPLPSDMEDAEEDPARRVSASPPPPPPAAARTWSMGGLFKKDPKVPTSEPSLVTPTASPNLLVSPQPQEDSPAGSTAFVSSWSRSVSQARPMSPPSLSTTAITAASPPLPPPKSKFSFFSSKSVAPPPPSAAIAEPLTSPSAPPPPPHDNIYDYDEPPTLPTKSVTESDPSITSSPPPVASPTLPPVPEVITTQPSSSQLSSPPPPSIPEDTEEIEPSSSSEDATVQAEEEIEVASDLGTLVIDEQEEVSLKD